MNFYAKNVFANFKIDFWCENETFGVNFKQDDATVMYYMYIYVSKVVSQNMVCYAFRGSTSRPE